MRQLSGHASVVFHGDTYGAYASQSIRSGDVVEIAPAIPFKRIREFDFLQDPEMIRAALPWRDGYLAAPLGGIAKYGVGAQHNVSIFPDYEDRSYRVVAIRDILSGERLVRLDEMDRGLDDSPSPRIEIPSHIEVNPIEVGAGIYGKGIISTAPIQEGDIIETCPTLTITEEHRHSAGLAGFGRYTYSWKPESGKTRFKPAGFSLGYGGIYNHSKQANLKALIWWGDGDIQMQALRDIEPGEELFHDYGWSASDKRFQV